ncbi:MAG: gliding motility protein GldM, partial [Bacteroidota bacterium]|nr:gliding motility protein GldM [Bacteroidota bacterium]
MAGGSANPLRQQMINMMYLVLTALLALNISTDILKAFALVNSGLEKTNISFNDKNAVTYKQIAKLYADDAVKNDTIYKNSQRVKQAADSMYNFIDQLKEEIAKQAGGWVMIDGKKTTVVKADEREIGTNYFINEEHGDVFYNKLKAYVATLQNQVYPEDKGKGRVNVDIPLDQTYTRPDGVVLPWVKYYFEDIPAIAVITELTQFQNSVRNGEAELVRYLFSKSGETDFKFDNLQAIVSSTTPFVLQGQEYTAEIFLGAYSSTQNPTITVNGQQLQVAGGKATYKVKAQGTGEKPVNAVITVKDPKGGTTSYDFKTAYQVFTGQATISAEKMNMLYIGLKNPISVSVAGYTPDQIIASCPGVAWSGSRGQYMATPSASSPREVFVNVSVKGAGGKTISMGRSNYRVRPVPKPFVMFGSKDGTASSITRGELSTVSFITATLGISFAFEGLNYTVTSYGIALSPKTSAGGATLYQETVSGNRLPGNVKAKLSSARPGDMILLYDVKAKGPESVGMVSL